MSYDNENFSSMCADANRIAAQLRGRQPLKHEVQLKKQTRWEAYTPVSGVRGKGAYLKVKKQAVLAEVLTYLHEFFAENDQIPPQACVAKRFGVFEQTAQDYMKCLSEAGHIERNAVGKWRFTRNKATPAG